MSSETHQDTLGEVYAPVFVGRPPSNAFVGLVRLEDGELRHYDYGEWQEPGRKRHYIFSRDNGFTWQEKELADGELGADARSPISGEYLRVTSSRDPDGTVVIRSKGGIDGEWTHTLVRPERFGMAKPAVFIRGGKRVLVGVGLSGKCGAGVLYSDDDGFTWQTSNFVTAPDHKPGGLHKGTRWNHGAVEPTVVELSDGRIWMLIRTSLDNLYESCSHDGGETWQEARPSRFHATCTMPTVGRLKDGRILLLWHNSTPLPPLVRSEELRVILGTDRASDGWELIFTNRDAIHAAISDDDGATWHGFRELFLDPRRNASDFADTGASDRGVHQSQFVDLGGGKVLVSFGQHWLHRSLVIFDTRWLYETNRSDDFAHGLRDWSVHMYVTGIRGHCALNRKPGAQLIDHPDTLGKKVLWIRRPADPSLWCQNQGGTWNFPAAKAGRFTTRILLRPGFGGARVSLIDRWFNPTDLLAHRFAMYSLQIAPDGGASGGSRLKLGTWHELRFEWDGLSRRAQHRCRLLVDGKPAGDLPLNRASRNGISYVQFISTAGEEDTQGFLVESVRAEAQ